MKLLMGILISFLAALCSFFLFQFVLGGVLNMYLEKTNYIEEQTNQLMGQLQGYVDRKYLTMYDADAITKWVESKKTLVISIYDENRLIYDSTDPYSAQIQNNQLEIPFYDWKEFYIIDFVDGPARVCVISFLNYQYESICKMISLFLAFFVFVIVITKLIMAKMRYINQLDWEIRVMESGDLTHSVTVKGNDELAYLARSVEEMRKSFIERQEGEDDARIANSRLITSMSHDLRTPLTTLIAYLDMLSLKKYDGEEEQERYIEKCRNKAYQIKALSDTLFSYFLMVQENLEERQIRLDTCDGREVFMQLTEENSCILREDGIEVIIEYVDAAFDIKVNMEYLCRIFDNIFSNIRKYADRERQVVIRQNLDCDQVEMVFENYIPKAMENVESNEIGLKNIDHMIGKMKGSCVVVRNEKRFILTISLPVQIVN